MPGRRGPRHRRGGEGGERRASRGVGKECECEPGWRGKNRRETGGVIRIETASLARRIGGELQRRAWSIAVAESLTGGMLTSYLARAPNASEWLLGGLVAYSRRVKHDVLHVQAGPVVSETAVARMAQGVCDLLGADLAVAVTGVGGPDPQDGEPPGTVWVAIHADNATTTELLHLDGDPTEICEATCRAALELSVRRLTRQFE